MPLLPLLRLLCQLRWIAVACQAAMVLAATGPLGMALPALPLWCGVGLLALFNIHATLRARSVREPGEGEVFAHVLVDITVLAWMIGWSGGVENPFSSLFLLPVALSILASSRRWAWITALASILGYGVSAWLAAPLPHVHGAFGDTFSLHKAGMLANFAVSAAVVLAVFSRLVVRWRRAEQEAARLRERFTRNEGIIALATHAASVAHELNTPLGTMMLMVEDLLDGTADAGRREEFATMKALLESCRDRVHELARPAGVEDGGARAGIDIGRVIEGWQLIRPTIALHRSGSAGVPGRVDAAVGHLLQALLNNAADASEAAGAQRVDLHLAVQPDGLRAAIRDYGRGLEGAAPVLPGTLYRTSKAEGLGIGLALSHATVERLGGTLSMQAATPGPGVVVSFWLPREALA